MNKKNLYTRSILIEKAPFWIIITNDSCAYNSNHNIPTTIGCWYCQNVGLTFMVRPSLEDDVHHTNFKTMYYIITDGFVNIDTYKGAIIEKIHCKRLK